MATASFARLGWLRGVVQELERNRSAIEARVRQACADAGRAPDAVRLVAVTKSVEPPIAAALARGGLVDLGESRAPELERKATHLAAEGLPVRWHFLGHLQRNKARRVVKLADEIHSVDSLRLLDTIDRLAEELDRSPRIYLEVHLSNEPQKHGFVADDVPEAVERAARSRLPLAGLMTMAPRIEPGESDAPARAVFDGLAKLASEIPADAFDGGHPHLSMGMSGDFELAIAAGSDIIRVGRAFFRDLPSETPATTGEDA